MSRILIIDDEAALVGSLSFALRGEGYDVVGVGTAADGLRSAERTAPSLVLLDLRLPDGSGIEVLEKLLVVLPGVPVIMVSAHGDTRVAVKSVKMGAFDYLTKPFELDELLLTIRSALERERMSQEIARFREATLAGGELVGESPAVRALAEATRQVGASHAGRVLLLGESGTGKALVARAIHSQSSRAKGPFVEVNCAALPEQLIEAELFGAEKGSYTGALQRRVGLAALADGGTLFLDEIGELPLALQAKILHFLEDGSYRPVGSGQAQRSDARVVAATNRDLAAEVQAGRFREDLYYRLNVVHLFVPPLRDRGNDILLLARHFAERYAREERCAPVGFDPKARAALYAYPWPGNVRELRNCIESAVVMASSGLVTLEDLPPGVGMSAADSDMRVPPGSSLADAERILIRETLAAQGGNKSRTAEILGIGRKTLYQKIQDYGLEPTD